MSSDCFRLNDIITLIPVVHGCGQYARAVEKWLSNHTFDCLAVPLPNSFRFSVLDAVDRLPSPSIVLQHPAETGDDSDMGMEHHSEDDLDDIDENPFKQLPESPLDRLDSTYGNSYESNDFQSDEYDSDNRRDESEIEEPEVVDGYYYGEVTDEIRREIFEDEEFDEDSPDFEMEFGNFGSAPTSYVPIDPCQSVIAAIRYAQAENITTEFIDLEVAVFEAESTSLPDGFALREVSLESFSAAVLPAIRRPSIQQTRDRILAMAANLRELATKYKQVVMICSIEHWPWIREAYQESENEKPANAVVETSENYGIHENTLTFLLGELPYITGVYEESRIVQSESKSNIVQSDSILAIDGIKRLLMSARSSYMADLGKRARRITPLLLSQCLKYIRNLTLLDSRLTPDLYTITVAAKQVLGDQFAIHVVEASSNYPFTEELPWPSLSLSIDQARLPDGSIVDMVNRLAGNPMQWRTIELNRRPLKSDSKEWQMRWNPYRQCSWPPEDDLIESFRTRVLDRARASLGADLARSEKFSTSLMDGIDIRETLRHWYDGNLYVKIQPPSVGHLDACILLFDAAADPREYPWRTTWFAEHKDESTLAFFATDFRNELLGPGVAVATYGGALFLYPPRSIDDIWTDERLDFADTLEDRLIAAACFHSQSKQIALLSPKPPNPTWRKWAKRHGKSLVHVPIGQFNDGVIQQLRTVHVLNGQEVRSYAAHFIRKV